MVLMVSGNSMATDIVGSWFPSGFYGHFRSKSRADFVCEYRKLARPQPPDKFYNRAKQPTRKHVFSHHDNRQAFLNDALIFQQGLGRRRVPNSTYNFKQDFITWMPEREYVERSRPLTSTYKVDFMTKASKNQLIVQRPKTSFEGLPTTTYRYAHGDVSPNKKTIDAMNNTALKLSLLNRKDKPMSGKNSHGRESVASCLTWVSSKTDTIKEEPVRPNIPPATQTTVYEPHPPTTQKPPSPTSPPRTVQQAWPSPEAPPPQVAPPPMPDVQIQIQQAPPPPQPEPMAE